MSKLTYQLLLYAAGALGFLLVVARTFWAMHAPGCDFPCVSASIRWPNMSPTIGLLVIVLFVAVLTAFALSKLIPPRPWTTARVTGDLLLAFSLPALFLWPSALLFAWVLNGTRIPLAVEPRLAGGVMEILVLLVLAIAITLISRDVRARRRGAT